MTGCPRLVSAALAAIALCGVASCGVLGSPAETDGDPWVNAGVSQTSTEVAQDMLPAVAGAFRHDLQSGTIKLTPKNLQPVAAWLAKPGPGYGPTSPPYWQILKASPARAAGNT